MSDDAVRIHVLDKRVPLLQPAQGFRTSLDSVMLAAACPAQAGDHIFDLGCGVGGAGLCVLRRVDGTRLTGVEIQSDHAALAQENAVLNAMGERAAFFAGDVRAFHVQDAGDHVICNPPYMDAGTYTESPCAQKAAALGHTEDSMDVAAWIEAGFRNLKSKGSITMIHRADHVDKIIQAFGRRFGGVEVIPLWPRTGEDAKRVIVRARKDRKSPARIHPGIVLHEESGAYTEEAERILRGMAAVA